MSPSLLRRRRALRSAPLPPVPATPSGPPPPSPAPFLSAPLLAHIPSLSVDYAALDADDPDPAPLLGPLTSFALFGFSRDLPRDPRYRALAKLRRVADEHGIADLQVSDFLRALRIHAAVIDRKAKNALVEQRRKENENPVSVKLDPVPRMVSVRKRSRPRPFHSADSMSDPPPEPAQDRFDFSIDDGSSGEDPWVSRRRWSLPEADDYVKDTGFASVSLPFSRECARHPAECLPPYPGSPNSSSSAELPSDTEIHTDTAPPPAPLPTNPPEVRPPHVQLIYHMLRHAESIYGFPVSIPSSPHVVLTRFTDRAIICRRTGIARDDLYTARSENTSFFPAHYVAVDRQIKAVVVCVRGTANLVDSLTDFAATQDPIRIRRAESSQDLEDVVHGHGHAGVLRSARNLFGKIRDKVLSALRSNPGFELMTTGHSLGGAAAAVLAMIMRDDPDFPRALAFAFAPLPCLTRDLAELTASFTVTVINGPDIVPRLSVAMLLPYFATARYVADLSRSQKLLIGLGFKSSVIDWDELMKHNAEIVSQLKQVHEGCRLYVPGKVFQLVRKNEVRRADAMLNRVFRRRDVAVVAVSRTEFLHVRARERGMFVSHAPFTYKHSLALALRGMEAEPLRKMSGGSVFRNLLAVPASPFITKRRRARPQESLDDLLQRIGGDLPFVETA